MSKKKNHFSRQCKNEQQESLSRDLQEQDLYDIPFYIQITAYLNYTRVELNGINYEMEIDTGYSLSLINEKQFYKLPNARLSKKDLFK